MCMTDSNVCWPTSWVAPPVWAMAGIRTWNFRVGTMLLGCGYTGIISMWVCSWLCRNRCAWVWSWVWGRHGLGIRRTLTSRHWMTGIRSSLWCRHGLVRVRSRLGCRHWLIWVSRHAKWYRSLWIKPISLVTRWLCTRLRHCSWNPWIGMLASRSWWIHWVSKLCGSMIRVRVATWSGLWFSRTLENKRGNKATLQRHKASSYSQKLRQIDVSC